MCGIAPALFRVQALVSAKVPAHLPLSMGVLPLTNAMWTKVAAHWPGCAESISMVRKRQPTIANAMIAGIDRDPAPIFSVNGKLRTSVDRCRSGNPIVDRDCCNTAAVYPEPTGQVWQAKKSFGATSGKVLSRSGAAFPLRRWMGTVEVATFFWHPHVPACRAALPQLAAQPSPSLADVATTFSCLATLRAACAGWVSGLEGSHPRMRCSTCVQGRWGAKVSSWPRTLRSCPLIMATAQQSNELLSDGAAPESARRRKHHECTRSFLIMESLGAVQLSVTVAGSCAARNWDDDSAHAEQG